MHKALFQVSLEMHKALFKALFQVSLGIPARRVPGGLIGVAGYARSRALSDSFLLFRSLLDPPGMHTYLCGVFLGGY